MTATVFVYGTLTDPERVAAVLEDTVHRGPATLEGLHRVDGDYPTLAPGGRVSGRLLEPPDLDALDRYEGVERGLYVRVAVPLLAGEADRAGAPTPEQGAGATCWTYVGHPARLGVGEEVAWPGEGPFPERVRAVVRDEPVVVRPDPG